MMACPATPEPKLAWRPAGAHVTVNGVPKLAFPRESLARRFASTRGMTWVRPYRCATCQDWHLGGIRGSRETT